MWPATSARGARGVTGSPTVGSVSSTAWMRSADAAARGTIANMTVPIITAMRIIAM